jgi:predicted metal-dependent phosphoesterase TrpH
VIAAKTAGLKGVALTDHDTTEGRDELMEASKKYDFPVVCGTELSLNFKGTTHMLGYSLGEGVDLDLNFIKHYRQDRNQEMFQKLLDLGFQLEWSKVEEIAEMGQIGKPHLALALLDHGYVHSKQEAFDRYLKKGAPAYVEKKRLSAKDGITLLLESGFAPVLAHPISLGLSPPEYLKNLELLKEWGLVGVEVYHPDNGEELSWLLNRVADKAGLVKTNGSDYHGANKNISLSWVIENSPITIRVLDQLRNGLHETRKRLKI